MTTFRRYRFFLPVVLVALVIAACSTTKNKWMHRQYHNMTSRFNGYFYAKENMKDALTQIDKTYVDDYSQLLPLFRLPNTPETKGCYPALEKAKKKASGVIEHHTITTKGGQEIPGAVKWIDENYLIIGESDYYKGEYLAAIEIFDYIILKYAQLDTRYDAILWKAKTEIEMNAYSEAESLLDVVNSNKATPARLAGDIKATYAYLYMQEGNNASAIKYLEEAIDLTKNKKVKARYIFILAQLYEKTGKEKDAYDSYEQVIGMHPQYDMLFNAKLSRARLSASDPKNRTAAKKELQKMLTDAKNTEFQDQIYYTLAQLEMGSKNEPGAVSYYKMSVSSSMGNNKQKSLSYLALGDIYFGKTDYKNAQAYYDSTMQFLPHEYPDYNAIDEKRKSLNNLVKYINLVSLEDSLQAVVKKYGDDTTKLYPFIDKIIEKVKADDKKKKDALDAQASSGGGAGGAGGVGNQGNQQGAWYFYNPSTIAFGATEFSRKWGNRKLEDNWRRANKESVVEDVQNDGGDTAKAGQGKTVVNDKYSRKYYIKDLPFTDSAVAASNERIADALFNLGTIYKEQMHNYPRSTEAFEDLCQRFPKHKYSLPSHFQLYRIYSDKNIKEQDPKKAKEHSDYICHTAPESEYCALINDPDHNVVLAKGKKEIAAYYDSTYVIYLRRDYAQVISRCNYADSTFGVKADKNEQVAMFAYLRAVSLGKTQGVAPMEAALTRILANYPKDPIRPQVQALLDAIHKTAPASADTTHAVTSLYHDNAEVEYQYMVIVETGKGDLNKFKIAVTDFNAANFGSAGYSVNSIILDDKHQCVTVKKFGNKKQANDYYMLLKSHPEIFAFLKAGSYQVMTISTENFAVFYKDKNIQTYSSFFQSAVLPK